MAENRVYGYARVSSRGQHLDRQITELVKFGVPERDIITDKASGKDTNRENYMCLRNQMLRKGDVLVVKELDRLSRNKEDIKKELEYFRAIGVRVKILDIPTTLIDVEGSSDKSSAWIMDMLNNILIEVIGSIAESERAKIKARQREGIDAAKAAGRKFGRPRVEFDKSRLEYEYSKVMSNEQTAVAAMNNLGMKRNTYYRLVKDYVNKQGAWSEE